MGRADMQRRRNRGGPAVGSASGVRYYGRNAHTSRSAPRGARGPRHRPRGSPGSLCSETILRIGVLDENEVAAEVRGKPVHPACSNLRGITDSIAESDDDAVCRRNYWLAVRKIVLFACRGPAVLLALGVNRDEVIGIALSDKEPGMRGPCRDTAAPHKPSTLDRQRVRDARA